MLLLVYLAKRKCRSFVGKRHQYVVSLLRMTPLERQGYEGGGAAAQRLAQDGD
jgi:hypothetical protein